MMSSGFDFADDLVQAEPWPIPRHVFITAEIGINHNGSLDLAMKLIDAAKAAGCDAVKFQKRDIEVVYTPEMLAQPRESPWGSTQRAQKEGLEFGAAEYDAIDAYCAANDILWYASAWDVGSQRFLRKYGLKYNKVASAMLTHTAFLEEVAQERKPTFLSTGMCEWPQLDAAVALFARHQCPVVLLHTVSEYPAPESALNLQLINALRRRYNLPVGYSGHESSVSPSVMAAMMGAVAIERHVTLDRAMYGSDQAASLEGAGLVSMVSQIRKIPVALGDGVKRVSDTEQAVAKKLRYWA